jgi:DNA-directed RNA polymerase
MTMPYGATLSGYKDQINSTLMEWQDAGKPVPDFGDDRWLGCAYLAGLIDDALAEIVVAAAKAMCWLQSVSDVISEENLPIYWTTPVGFPVLQNYRNVLTKAVRTEIAGKFYNTSVAYGNGNKMNKRKMKAAISPNFVHSCDAAHLVRTVNLCEANNINSLAMVHDSYGTHAADIPMLRELLRHAFVQIHDTDPLQSFYEAMCEQSSTPEKIPKPPPKGSLDILRVLEADFFFA